jgi:hypothetical protein
VSVDPRLLRGWLANCESNHGSNCNHGNYDTARYRLPIDITVIDVWSHCLIRTTSDVRYMALSYVWGGIPMLASTKKNFADLHRPGCLNQRSDVPQVVKDAMVLVNMLGSRYLWVDRLCIVQDSPHKHDHISKMDIIYSHALLTIAAVDGLNAGTNLPGILPRSRLPVLHEEVLNGVQYKSEPASLDRILEASIYERRGWTFQERMLSRRVLYISNQQVYFQCNVSIRSESHPREFKRERFDDKYSWGLGQRIDDIRLRGAYEEQVLNDVLETGQNKKDHWLSDLAVYQNLVEEYSHRELTYPTDMLNAFSGFTAIFEECSGGRFVSGIPISVLSAALLWSGHFGASAGRKSWKGEALFPSWSWAGWSLDRVFYRQLVGIAGGGDGDKNVFSRLESIAIYIDGASRSLRPLRDISAVNAPQIWVHPRGAEHPYCPPLPLIRFRAPVIPASRFEIPLFHEPGGGDSDGTFIHSRADAMRRVGVVLDIGPADLARVACEGVACAGDLSASSQLHLVLVSHDFDPLRRAILRASYRAPTPRGSVSAGGGGGGEGGGRGAAPHTLNLLVVRDRGRFFERVAPAKMFSEAWPLPKEGEDQKREVFLA